MSVSGGYYELGSGVGKERITRKEIEVARKSHEIKKIQKERERSLKECGAAEKDYQGVKKRREAELNKSGKIKKREEEEGGRRKNRLLQE